MASPYGYGNSGYAPYGVGYAPYSAGYAGGYASQVAGYGGGYATNVAGYGGGYATNVAGYGGGYATNTAGYAAPYAAGYATQSAGYAAGYAAPYAAGYAPYYAAPIQTPSSQFHAQEEFGNVNYGYSNINSQKHEVGNGYGGVTGGYSYVDANGEVQKVEYIADALGFRVTGTNIPVAPEVPEVELPVAPVYTCLLYTSPSPRDS